jgi:hypothetical protein
MQMNDSTSAAGLPVSALKDDTVEIPVSVLKDDEMDIHAEKGMANAAAVVQNDTVVQTPVANEGDVLTGKQEHCKKANTA